MSEKNRLQGGDFLTHTVDHLYVLTKNDQLLARTELRGQTSMNIEVWPLSSPHYSGNNPGQVVHT